MVRTRLHTEVQPVVTLQQVQQDELRRDAERDRKLAVLRGLLDSASHRADADDNTDLVGLSSAMVTRVASEVGTWEGSMSCPSVTPSLQHDDAVAMLQLLEEDLLADEGGDVPEVAFAALGGTDSDHDAVTSDDEDDENDDKEDEWWRDLDAPDETPGEEWWRQLPASFWLK